MYECVGASALTCADQRLLPRNARVDKHARYSCQSYSGNVGVGAMALQGPAKDECFSIVCRIRNRLYTKYWGKGYCKHEADHVQASALICTVYYLLVAAHGEHVPWDF